MSCDMDINERIQGAPEGAIIADVRTPEEYALKPGVKSDRIVFDVPDGLDLTAVAQQVFVPAQGNA